MKKYLEDLRQELLKRKLTKKEIDEIIADHTEMISSALDEGLSEDEIKEKFGKPSQVAEELAESEDEETAEQEGTDDYQLLQSFEVKGDSITVDVNLISEDIIYQLGSDSKIRVYYEGKGKVDNYEISFEKNEFRLSAPKRLGFSFNINKNDGICFLVELPKQVVLEQFKHVTVSSDSTITNVEAKELIVRTTSGDLEVTHSKIEKIKLNSVSGDSEIKDSSIGELVISQVSGDTSMIRTKISKDFKSSSVSGDLELNDVTCVNFEVSAVSGDVDGKEFYPQKITFKSVSGDINIKNKEKKYIEIARKSTLSGDINIH